MNVKSVSPAYTLGGTSSQNSVFFAICNVDFFQWQLSYADASAAAL